jgi:hypothetical protein
MYCRESKLSNHSSERCFVRVCASRLQITGSNVQPHTINASPSAATELPVSMVATALYSCHIPWPWIAHFIMQLASGLTSSNAACLAQLHQP